MVEFATGIVWGEVPPVDLVMGSDSDSYVVEETGDLLARFGVPYRPKILSADRTPIELGKYCEEARVRDEELVIMAFAGMAAVLGGSIAAQVPQTVIGVPLTKKQDTMEAATVAQLFKPPGSGLTIVGPDQAENAGLAAIRTLGTSHPELRVALLQYQESKRKGVVEKDAQLTADGLKAFNDERRSKN